jgi:hypothetical protein
MMGIATVDRIMGEAFVAIWLTNRSAALEATHGNAVVIDLVNDPDAIEKVRSLTRLYAVLVTNGTDTDGLPIEGQPLTVSDIDAWVAETEAHQQAIEAAVDDYKRRTRQKGLVPPTFPVSPSWADFTPSENTPGKRALATANYVARVWTNWLKTDEERRRRTVQPKTGKTPWIMPEELNQAEVAEFPSAFAARVQSQPLV